jgi:hypothetical protein
MVSQNHKTQDATFAEPIVCFYFSQKLIMMKSMQLFSVIVTLLVVGSLPQSHAERWLQVSCGVTGGPPDEIDDPGNNVPEGQIGIPVGASKSIAMLLYRYVLFHSTLANATGALPISFGSQGSYDKVADAGLCHTTRFLSAYPRPFHRRRKSLVRTIRVKWYKSVRCADRNVSGWLGM